MTDLNTIPGLLLRNESDASFSSLPAMRNKELGIWQTFTWAEYVENTREFALGLASLGFERGDKLSVIGNNRPRLYWAQLAAMCLGGQSVPVYQDAIATELAFVLEHSETKVIVAEDQEQVDKILSIKDKLPALKWLIYCDSRGMTDYEEDIVKSFAELQELGRDFRANSPSYFEDEAAKVTGDDIALMAYTSGTTGQPKGVMLSHNNLMVVTDILVKHEDIRQSDDTLAYLPMAWVGDVLYGLCISLKIGSAYNCPESPETLMQDLRDLGPTGFLAPPRVWEGMLSQLQLKGADASPLKRWIFSYFQKVAEDIENLKFEGKPASAWLILMHAIGEVVVYGPVRDQLGLRRARWCYTGGAPLGPDAFRFFRGFGVNLKQLYASTELSGLATLQPNSEANADTVGPACEGVEIKIDDDNGEILIRSAGVFRGYYKEDAKTAEAVDSEGWFHTGDAGVIDENGHLVVIDRAKDVGKLEDGTAFAPQFIELKLKFSPFINEAVAFGDEHPFVSSMIAIDFETVGKWAERRALPYTNYTDLATKQEVRELIADEIRKINLRLPEVSRIKRFLLLTKDLDADDNEVTRTRKLRRGYIAEKYAPVIEAFYGGQKDVQLKLDVTFEDGSKAQVDSHMFIEEAA